jgi:hypothetical protein
MIDGKPLTIHRLYLEAARPVHASNLVVDHIDRNSHNNLLSNLRWVTQSDNVKNQDKRKKYNRSIAHEELPEDCMELSGTNVLYNITKKEDGTIDEIFLYSPIGKGKHPDYREFDLTMNTIEADLSGGGVFFKYNPHFGKSDKGKRLSITSLLHRLRRESVVSDDLYNDICNRKHTIKEPAMMERIRRIINKSGYIKGGSHSFIISYWDLYKRDYD